MKRGSKDYSAGFQRGYEAAHSPDWREMEVGGAYEAGAIDVHQAYDELVRFATDVEKHTRGPAHARPSKEFKAGVADGVRAGALARLELDAEGRKHWGDDKRVAFYASIEQDLEKRRKEHGMTRQRNLHPRTKATLGAAGGSLVGSAVLGWPGSIAGGAAGGGLAAPKGRKEGSAWGGGIGGALGPLGAALGGYIGSKKRKRNPDISHLFEGDVVAAERQGGNVLVLRRLEKPMVRADGEEATYELAYLWLAHPGADLSRVAGNDYSYWVDQEYDPKQSLFEQFLLFANPVRRLTEVEGYALGYLTSEPLTKTELSEAFEDDPDVSPAKVREAVVALEADGMIRKRGRELVITGSGAIAHHRWYEEMMLAEGEEPEELSRAELARIREMVGRSANPTQVRSTARKLVVAHRGNRQAAYEDAARRAELARGDKLKGVATFWTDVGSAISGRQANLSRRAKAAIGAGLGAAVGGFFGTMIGGGAGLAAAAGSESGAAVAAVPLGGMLGFVLGSTGGGAAGGSLAVPKGYKRRAAAGGAIGGLLGPLGAAGGAYLATERKEKLSRNTATLKRRLLRE